MSTATLSRRAALTGSLASAAAVALATPALALVEPSPLPKMIEAYHGAKRALAAADEAFNAAVDAIEASIPATVRHVKLTERGFGPHEWQKLDAGWDGESLRNLVNERFAERIAKAEARLAKERSDPSAGPLITAGLMPGPDKIREEHARVLAKATAAGDQLDALRERYGYEAAEQRSADAWEAMDDTKTAILSHRPASLGEVQMIASFVRKEIAAPSEWPVKAMDEIRAILDTLAGEA